MHISIIKAKKMDATWFLSILNLFKGCISRCFDHDLYFAARIQRLQPLSSIYYCDNKDQLIEAKNRGYAIEPFANFAEDVIRNLWNIQDSHWQVSIAVFGGVGLEAISTLVFYSYAPAVEILSSRSISAPRHLILTKPFLNDPDLDVAMGQEAAMRLRKEMDKARFLPLSDPRFASMRT